ncbi:MAG: diadenylate cyclase CdaA [Bacteroidales bacterium]|nr:diadenylate cyclase CdaA [Bacteroidales bacterium]MBR6272604.1 diadenylate cyclase CdaA [Bacteroidales bacterium]
MLDLFIQIRIVDIIDIVLVAALLYTLYRLLKGTGAISIFIGIVAIFLLWQLVNALQMELLSSILGAFVNVGFIALIVIFQPEIRRFLFTIGTQTKNGNIKTFKILRKKRKGVSLDTAALCSACQSMSNIKQGALIVLTRDNTLTDIVLTGVSINAEISKPLIENIFFKNSPLHDGAMIITDNRIVAARCILPVTNNSEIPGHYGLRHRAAVGVSENNDCIVLVVSEETGNISLVKAGAITTLDPETMEGKLVEEMKR